MYSITEVPMTHPALIALFVSLSESLGKLEAEPELPKSAQSGLLIAVVAWHDGKAVGCGLLRQEAAGQVEMSGKILSCGQCMIAVSSHANP